MNPLLITTSVIYVNSSERELARRSSLDIPSHGHLPQWLEDMSSAVERSHSLIMEKEYLLKSAESNNNTDRFGAFSPSFPVAYNGRRQSGDSSASGSAKYGRRASASVGATPLKKPFVVQDMDAYIVPKIDHLDFGTLTKEQYKSFSFKPVYKEPSAEDDSVSDDQYKSYSPSILDQSTGRRSRLELLEDQLVAGIKEATINDSECPRPDYNTAHCNYKVSNSREFVEPKKPAEWNHQENNSQQMNRRKTEPLDDFLKSDDSSGRKKNFEEDLLMVKSKIQKYKRVKSDKKARFKHQNLAAIRQESLYSEMPQNYLRDNSEENLCVSRNFEQEEVFIIPELPAGNIMILDILSTWGDRYYVGLNGIELFDSDGNIVQVRKITAYPEDINVLPECNGDPRIVTNLLDGVNRTQDDLHLWLTPFDSGEHHLVTIEFYKKTELAMIRIWNYNKSRIHSFRGAKDVIMTLDGVCIFRGEIAQACGSILGGIESFGDTILFTTEENILEKIARNDVSFSTLMSVAEKEGAERTERPSTATAVDEVHQRPYTHAFTPKPDLEHGDQLFGAQRLDIVLILNWGKVDYIGLTGLEVIGDSDISLTVTKENLRSNNITTGAMLARLVDDENITTDRKHMWYTQYIPGEEILISVVFDHLTYIAGIRVWNYNENLEMSFCGARMLKIFLDNKPMMNPLTNDTTFLLRRAPGNTHYDFVQEIRFSSCSLDEMHQEQPFYNLNNIPSAKEDLFENPIMPEGFVFQIVIYTTWGDQYYVGLNGIEIFDQNGKKIVLSESNICAHPESVNVLPGVSGDVRTPDKLVDGINDRSDGTHSWLVPVIPKCLNRIYIVFDQPVAMSVMKIWNYLKTPARGVKEFGILVDDLLIYNGILDKISEKSSVKYRTILFTNNKNVLQKEMASLVKHSIDSQATILTNDEPRATTGGSLPNVDQSLRPFTSVNYLSRGRTSQSN